MDGWGGLKQAGAYINKSSRTMKRHCENGLPHSVLPNGVIMIRFADIDEYLSQYAVTRTKVDKKAENKIDKEVENEVDKEVVAFMRDFK